MRRFAPHRYAALDEGGLDKATDAFRRGDFARAVTACLSAETGLSIRTLAHSEGPAWVVAGAESTVFVFVELGTMQLVIESPIARLPRTQRVAAMRFALEICEDDRLSSRICLRDDLLVMRFIAQLGAAPPALIRHVVNEVLTMSERYTEIFIAAFNARVPTRAGVRIGAESMGKKRQLGTLRPSTPRAPIVQPPPPTLRPDFSPQRDDDLPPILSTVFGGDSVRRGPSDELPHPFSAPFMREPRRASAQSSDGIPAILAPPSKLRELKRSASSDQIPAILAPQQSTGKPLSFDDIPAILAPSSMLDSSASDAWDAMPAVLMPTEAPSAAARISLPLSVAVPSSAPHERETSPTTARLGAIPAVMMTTSAAGTRQRTAMGLSDAGRMIGTDPATDVSGRRAAPNPDLPPTPADKLCELLQRAQVLATTLSFAERQATTLLLVRAVVYRAIYDYSENVPDAVSYLSRTTAAATRMIWSSSEPPDKNAPMPMAEPSLLAMERVVAQRAQMPKEPKLASQPFTTATQAREHLAKYVEEIEQAPNDQPLRHFLAVGALCELLARARLPSQTAQKIKDIVAHAQREANKPAPSLDLMMAALKRIITG